MTTKQKIRRGGPKRLTVSRNSKTYEDDFFKWTKNQARLLKKKEFSNLDIDNLIEEIESLGRLEKRTLQSYLELLLMHMLKVEYQAEKHSKSWDLSIKEARLKVKTTLLDNPSLKPKFKSIVETAYASARIKAALETKLDEAKFPEVCPWKLQEIFPDLEKKYC